MLGCALSAYARIGETKSALANRLFDKVQRAYVYSAKEDRLREALELPYKNKLFLFPDGAEHIFLYKNASSKQSAQGDTTQQHELYGWEIHIVCLNGKSVLEFYRRHGDPMTVEELEQLMQIAVKNVGDKWQYVSEIPSARKWRFDFSGGEVKDVSRLGGKSLRDILPVSPTRFIYAEIPEEVQNDGAFKTSLVADMLNIERREANARYRNYVSKQVSQKAAKTAKNKNARKNAPAKINVWSLQGMRYMTQTAFNPQENMLSIFEYDVPFFQFGSRVPPSYDKSIQTTITIPLRADTAFGYNYQTADKAVRATLYKDAVLFVDAKFDSALREYMETLFRRQSAKRAMEAEESVSGF